MKIKFLKNVNEYSAGDEVEMTKKFAQPYVDAKLALVVGGDVEPKVEEVDDGSDADNS